MPNDPSNEARALLLLETLGLIELDPEAGVNATKLSITKNEKNLEIVEVEAAQLPRMLPDFDLAVINGNYALDAGLSLLTDTVGAEGSDALVYAQSVNYIVVKEGNEEAAFVEALREVLNDEATQEFITETYQGSVVLALDAEPLAEERLPRRNKRGETLWQSPPFHNKPRRARETAPSACRKRPAAPAFSDGLSLQGCFSALQRRGHHVPVREAHGRNMIAEAACSRSSRRTCRRCGWHRKGLAAPSCIPAEVCSICRYAKTLLRKASEPAAHVAGFGWHLEGFGPPSLPKGGSDGPPPRFRCYTYIYSCPLFAPAAMVYTTRMETRASDKIEALVLDVSFRNEENGFTVLQVRLDDGRRVAAVGVMPELAGGERVALTGEWSEHPQYGRQIRVTLCEAHAPTTLSGIERYLGSGLLRGVGPATARQIVERFGEDTLDILQYAPERLREISGIGAKRARRIAESFAEQHQMRKPWSICRGTACLRRCR